MKRLLTASLGVMLILALGIISCDRDRDLTGPTEMIQSLDGQATLQRAAKLTTSEEESNQRSYITVVVADDESDPDNVITSFTITWSDTDDCSDNYNAYLFYTVYHRNSRPAFEKIQTHLGLAASGETQITNSLSNLNGASGFRVALYCGTSSDRRISTVWIPQYYDASNRSPVPDTYTSEPPLTALAVSSGTLTPTFHRHTLAYTVPDVANANSRITITATAGTDYNYVFVKDPALLIVRLCSPTILSLGCGEPHYGEDAVVLIDADADTPGFQVDLGEGENSIAIRVHKGDDLGSFYSLTVTRAASGTVNTPATGAPAISDTVQVQVGQTLTASTSGIADADGLTNASFSYQWVSSDGTSDTDISDATGSTYTLVEADAGNTIKVRVSFTDDAGHAESLTSAATGEVAAAAIPLTAEFQNVPDSHNSTDTFTFRVVFSEAVGTSYKTLRDHSFEVTNGSVTGARRVDGRSDLWEITVEPDSDADVTVVLPITDDCDAQDAVCTSDDKQLSNRSEITVSGP